MTQMYAFLLLTKQAFQFTGNSWMLACDFGQKKSFHELQKCEKGWSKEVQKWKNGEAQLFDLFIDI